MVYTCQYQSPMGDILLAADEIGLTGLWFVGQKYFANILPDEHIVRETPILAESQRWLDVYFSGQEPKFTPSLHPDGTVFRHAVWEILLQIPYGETITYGEIARRFFRRRTEFYTASASDRLYIQTGSVADFAADSVWSDNDIRRDCQTTG